MALTKNDKELIVATIKSGIADAMQEVIVKVDRHDVSLYGQAGNNGMSKDVSTLKKWRWYLSGVFAVLVFLMSVFGYTFAQRLDKVFDYVAKHEILQPYK